MSFSGQSSKQGFAPVTQTSADFQQDEMLGLAGGTARTKIGDSGIVLSVPYVLKSRKIYAWMYVIPGNYTIGTPGLVGSSSGWNGCLCAATIDFSFNGSIVGSLPLSFKTVPVLYYEFTAGTSPISDVVVISRSVASLLSVGGATQDTMSINLVNPITATNIPAGSGLAGTVFTNVIPAQPATLTLQPHYIDGNFDTVKCNIKTSLNCFDIRIFLAVESNQ